MSIEQDLEKVFRKHFGEGSHVELIYAAGTEPHCGYGLVIGVSVEGFVVTPGLAAMNEKNKQDVSEH